MLAEARAAKSGRAGHTLTPGAGARLKQTLLALTVGTVLADHESPGEATLHVLSGTVDLTAGDTTIRLNTGGYSPIPLMRHGVPASTTPSYWSPSPTAERGVPMCDYCGCLSHAVIADLTEDHEQIAAVAGSAAAAHTAGNRDEVRSAVTRIVELLEPHTAREESVLFPELAAAGAQAHTESLADEHAVLDALLAAVLEDIETGWDLLPGALDLLHTHIWREDYDVFPAALQLLGPAAWARVAGIDSRV